MGWNVRGLNKRDKQRSVLEICRENKVGLGALLETKINHDKVGDMIAMSFPNWEFFSSIASSKRIILIWQAKFMHVEVLLDNEQFIHSKVKIVGLIEEFYFTAVYGSNCPAERKLLFEKLAALGMLNRPWLILGDFNAMFNFQDRNGGKQILTKDIEDAQKWLSLGQVEEVSCSGAFYTWTNKHDMGTRIFSKLDRVLINEDWLDQFPNTEACFKWDCISDHSYCIVKSNRIGNVGIKPFRYCNHWSFHSCFREWVLCCWNKFSDANTVGELVKKMLRVKHVLKKFNREEVGDVEKLYNQCKADFITAQESLAKDPNNSLLLQEENRLGHEYAAALKQYTCFLRQQSKVSWLQNGEDNTKYFHSLMKKRKLENRITTFESHGQIVDDYSEVVEHFLNHFRNFMGKKSSATRRLNQDCIQQGRTLTLEQQAKLIRPFTEKDVKKAMFEVLPCLVSDNQGAFVKNRLLAHNIMIFQDLLKGYTRRVVSARCIMKIDLRKAYDTVDWHFVEDILNNLCFPSRFIHWLLVCLRGTNYFLLLNGRIQGSFKGEKGLRQGDPLSPLLFVLIMEYLSRLLSQVSNKKEFGFHPLCKNLRLTNLCFADDLIIFCKGNMKSVELVNDAFQEFCQATGLSANKKKSHIYFGGVKEETKINILALTQMEEGSFPLNYLGVKLRPTKWKASDCGVILDKLRLKLNGWASRNLSFAGRAQLIQSVLLGIHTFWMSLFILPQKIVAAIDKNCRDFLWGMNGNRSKLHTPSWGKVCLPKHSGGIGFREGKLWNVALIAKHLWALSNKQDNLWVKWINSIYLKGQDVWSYLVKPDRFYDEMLGAAKVPYATNVWHKLIVPKHRFIYWQVINEHLLTRDILSRFLPIASDLCVVCDMDPESHNHIFIDCIFAKKLIKRVEGWSGVLNWPSCLREFHQIKPAKTDLAAAVLNAVIAAVLYMLWKNRNDCFLMMFVTMFLPLVKKLSVLLRLELLGFIVKAKRGKISML
ncbi:uncharacterized protein LOC133036230 [Cannabis sativa]|uniref:uncharacterized protein LOC133036230 n=1 Tax=Cannabis sativa TaxID=3483 RepID=UPI0029CA4FD8|nr:uncharacterized protein LOC133036230 [Cannabis sativa]